MVSPQAAKLPRSTGLLTKKKKKQISENGFSPGSEAAQEPRGDHSPIRISSSSTWGARFRGNLVPAVRPAPPPPAHVRAILG